MSVLDWILPARCHKRVLEIARQVAADQHDRVWQRLSHRAGSLGSVPEARGYVRCRAVGVLRSGLQCALEPAKDLTPELRDRVIETAAELLMGKFVGPMVSAAPVQCSNRRAA